MFLVEWPRGNCEEEGQGSAAQPYVDGELDILEDVTDNEGEKLEHAQLALGHQPGHRIERELGDLLAFKVLQGSFS